MQKDFECWDCHKCFHADDSSYVKCPHCNSDNVEYATYHLPKWVKWIVPAIAFTGFIVWGISVFPIKNTEKTVAEKDTTTVTQASVDSAFLNETGLSIPPSIRIIGDIVPNEEGLYSFEATVDYPPAQPYYFTLTDRISNQLVMRSNDGKFTDVPYSSFEGGAYYIQIISTQGDSLLSSPQELPGFIKIEKISRKMTPSELQSLLMKHDESLLGVGENKYLSPVCKLHFEGLSKGMDVPTDLAGVLQKLEFKTWKSVTVKSLEYDDTKHINVIVFKVVADKPLNEDEWE